MFLRGQITVGDGSAVPHDMLVERVCTERIVQQVYAGPRGDFNMQLGSKTEIIDASGDVDYRSVTNETVSNSGVPRHQLQTCELRTSAAGFRPSIYRLVDLDVTSGSVDVGQIPVQRIMKTDGRTLNAAAYRAPKDAVKEYEKGIATSKDKKYTDAEKHFERAVSIYPKYGRAWYQLGVVRQSVKNNDGAKAAYTQATNVERKFLAPYLKLAEMAYTASDWPEVLRLTEHIIEMDPMMNSNGTGYVVDLDPINAGIAYYYNAVAHYQTGQIDAAEKSALKAEHVDLMTKFPQVHLLMAKIDSDKGNYAGAISEIHTYMELVPGSKDVEPLRTKLAQLEELNAKAGAEKR
jgi:tetratricopeptide (TPR) repeat protein